MNTIRPQLRFSMPGISARESRTPDMTLISKKRSQSSSGMSKKDFGSKTPALFTRMSAEPRALTSAAQPAAVERSAATPSTLASGWADFSFSSAALTLASLRPLITTRAPQLARPRAMAWPMPAVEPVTIAVLPLRSMFKPWSPCR